MPRVDQREQINTSSILRRVLNQNGTLAVEGLDSDQEAYYLLDRSREQTTIDGVDVNLDVLTITEYEDQNHMRLRKTTIVKTRGRDVISIDIIPTQSPAELRS